MNGTVVVLLHVADPPDAPGSVLAAYHAVSQALDGTRGLAGSALLGSVTDPLVFVIASRWTDARAFQAWEGGAAHRAATAPLRPLQVPAGGQAFGVYQVVASYGPGDRLLAAGGSGRGERHA